MTLTNLDPLLRTFTDALLPESPVTVRRRQGTIDAINASTVDVSIGGLVIPGVSYLRSYAPVVGDVVFVDLNGSDPLVIGSVAAKAWPTFNSAPTPTSGSFISAAGAGAFIKLGTTVHYRYSATITNVGTGTGDVVFTLPVAPHSAVRAFGAGREDGVSGSVLVVYSGGGSIGQIRAGVALASGQQLNVAGTYEAAA